LQVKGKLIPSLIDGTPDNRLVRVHDRIRNDCPALVLNTIAIVFDRQGDSCRTYLAAFHFFSSFFAASREKQTRANSQCYSKLHAARSHDKFLSTACATLPRWDLLSSKTIASILPSAPPPLSRPANPTPRR
ncbi:MAG: hypothetical protein WCC92_01530, partial [Candidatus Korobacteraceae bacterium]